jgi:hypothetical protein
VKHQSKAQTIENQEVEQQSRLQTIEKRVWWLVGAVAVLAILFVINRFFIHHPLWDWIELLIVPAILTGGGSGSTRSRERVSNGRRSAVHRTTHSKHTWTGWRAC